MSDDGAHKLPFAHLRVVELGNVIAGPLCASLMADFGADVIKIERREGGDPGRHLGPEIDGVSVWWGVGARDKRCIALNLKNDTDRDTFLDLVRQADVLIENNRPGALDRLELGRDRLKQVNPALVMLSVSGYGQTGPMARNPGFGKIAEAFSGIVPLTGSPDKTPLHVGFSLADASASLFGLLGISMALWARECNGRTAAPIDLALYEPLFRMTELQAAQFDKQGERPTRNGTNNPYGWGAADDTTRFVGAVSADGIELSVLVDAESSARLEKLLEFPADPITALRGWIALQTSEQVADALRLAGVEVAPVHDGLSISRDAYFRQRGDVETAVLPSGRSITVPGHLLRQLGSGGLRSFRAATLGADQDSVMKGGWNGTDGN